MTTKSELLPCPFCGGSASVLDRTCEPDTPYNPMDRLYPIVRCGCGVEIAGSDLSPIEDVIKKWNTRAYPPHVQAVLDAANDEAHLHTVGMTPDGRPFEYPCECHFCLAVKAYKENP